jgi:putative ABC transport system ATP-binding protein
MRQKSFKRPRADIVLQISNISKAFHAGTTNEVRALSGVSVDLEPGSFLIIIGTNGSGKSTLLNAVAGSFRVDTGAMHVANQDITRWPEHRRAKLIGRVFQNPFSGTAPNMSIAENIALATRRGLSRGLGSNVSPRLRDEIRDRVRSLKMGLEDRIDNPIGTLSGGQRQALTLLMASWLKPDLLLLDEHTAALDPKSADQVIQLTAEIVGRDKLTTLMVTHSMQQAVDLGDRVVMMHKGRVLHDIKGAAREGLTADDLLRRFDDIRRREQLEKPAESLLREAQGASELIAILGAVAAVDAHLDAREIALIQAFAAQWGLEVPELEAGALSVLQDFSALCEIVQRYLALQPPRQQATELLDLLQHMVHADDAVSAEEEIVLEEITAMLVGYVTLRSDDARYEVVVVPQAEEQNPLIMSLLPGVLPVAKSGGMVYSVGRFNSARFADLVAKKYIDHGLLTVCLAIG